jgi:hypothetical protein
MGVHKEGTSKELAAYMPDVPRRTLYRHINFLVECGIIKVKETRQVRGGTERVLVDNQIEFHSGMKPLDISYQFFMNLYNQFARYWEQHGDKPLEKASDDVLGFITSTFILDDDETMKMIEEVGEVVKKYDNEHHKKYGDKKVGKIRSFSYILSPVDQENT